MRPSHAILVAATYTFAAGAALAQSGPADEDAALDKKLPVPTWKIRFEPNAWYVAPGGDLTLPTSGGGQKTDVSVFDMDNPRLSPAGELDIRAGSWRLTFGGFSFQAKTNASAATESGQIGNTAFNEGDPLKSSMDFQSFQATVGYRLCDEALNPENGVYAVVFGLDVLVGARTYDMSVLVQQAAGPDMSATDEFFADPIAGLRADFDFYKVFSIDFRTTAGYYPGDRSVWSFDIALSGVYRPIENVGIMVGYRQLLFDLATGDGNSEFEFRGGLAGLFAGVELRF